VFKYKESEGMKSRKSLDFSEYYDKNDQCLP